MKKIRAFIFLLAMPLAASLAATPNLTTNIDRPLRYHPDGTDFVIENGSEFFNRPLYGTNTAFRVDAGDKPEFVLYLPGRGGNLRIGMKTATGAKWLFDADKIVTRYRPGSMLYEIKDALLKSGTLHLTALAMDKTEGFVIRATVEGADDIELIYAYGGVNGQRGSRDGDIGCEKVPVSQFFQLKPEFCKDNEFTIHTTDFTMRSKPATITGLASAGSKLSLADAMKWDSLNDLLAVAGRPVPELAVAVSRLTLQAGKPSYFALQRVNQNENSSEDLQTYKEVRSDASEKSAPKIAALAPTYKSEQLAQLFEDAEKHRREIAERIVVDTPDAFINAAASALCVAADGVWDEAQGAFMHGAVAWRTRLLGWRGAYSGDALGWHDRTERHLANWFSKQNAEPITVTGEPAKVPQDASVYFARNEPELHSNGDLSHSHYDMNLPAIDILFRHILWTGDLDYARKIWPVIEHHLAWERRLFRREFGPEKLPLYEAYCCIWASDDLQYEGGGAAHSSALNYYHNKMAARVAKLIGVNAKPYEREAELINKAMHHELWLSDRGWFAEWKDLLGLQLTHDSPALWTFYHTIDSEVPTPMEAWQMTRFVDTQIAHIPLRGAGVPEGFYTLPTTSWMPYTWSTNNVVMAEVAHTSLAYWQAGRGEEGFRLFKGCLLDSMFMGLCPGNVGMCTQFDMARRESQRDFADSCGATSRALVEGLFGIKPDALAGELVIRPSFPAGWDHASIFHPDFSFKYQRNELTETYSVESRFPKPMGIRVQVPALRDSVVNVTVNGRTAKWRMVEDSVELPSMEIQSTTATKYDVVISWKGEDVPRVKPPIAIPKNLSPYDVTIRDQSRERDQSSAVPMDEEISAGFGVAKLVHVVDQQQALSKTSEQTNEFRATVTTEVGNHSVFARIQQGVLDWWMPVLFEIRPKYEIITSEIQDETHLRFHPQWNTADGDDKQLISIALVGDVVLPADGFLPGSNRVTTKQPGLMSFEGIAINWKIKAPATTHWDYVNLTTTFNDKITQIFKNEYLSPRSPYCSLAMPKQGIGSWIHWNPATDRLADANIEDSGLRAVADKNQGRLLLPNGIPFQTPGTGDAKNIAFTSQCDNYPHEIAVPLNGKAEHAYLLMAGSTNSMQSQFDNGEVIVTYTDGSTQRLALRNPTNWWPIDQDYFIDDYAFNRPEPIPPRVNLKTGEVRILDLKDFKGKGGKIDGGAATVLDMPLDSKKELKSVTMRTLANEVVIGLMSLTLVRP